MNGSTATTPGTALVEVRVDAKADEVDIYPRSRTTAYTSGRLGVNIRMLGGGYSFPWRTKSGHCNVWNTTHVAPRDNNIGGQGELQ